MSFSDMDPEKQREIAGKGGAAAHKKGVAHKWAKGSEAAEAGRRGGLARARNLKKRLEEKK